MNILSISPNRSKRIITLLLLTGFVVSVEAFTRTEYKKEIKKTFSVDADTWVQAANKYGNVHIHTWDKNEVSYEITITVDARSESEAQEQLDRVSINFMEDQGRVKAETAFAEVKSKRWTLFNPDSWTWSGGNSWNKDKLQVDYIINMPAQNPTDIDNKYGNIHFPVLDNEARFRVKYGNLKGGKIGKNLDLYIGYGNGDIEEVAGKSDIEVSYGNFNAERLDDLDLESKYSNITTEYAGDVNMDSKYGKYDLGTIQNLNSDSKYDNFVIEKVDEVEIESKYSDYRIEEMTGRGEMEMTYGNTKIKQLGANFGHLEIDGSYHDFSIWLESGTSFTIDAEGSYSDFDFPDGTLQYEKDNTWKKVTGYVGDPSCNNHIKADLRYGDLTVRE